MQEQNERAKPNTDQARGATMVEYALLISLIAVIALAAVRYIGTNVSKQYSTVAHTMVSS